MTSDVAWFVGGRLEHAAHDLGARRAAHVVSGLFSFKPFWRERELASSYDVVIIGGGAHGLATAYELTKRGITNVAVLEMNYIGAGGSGRNTTILRAELQDARGHRVLRREPQDLSSSSRRSSTSTC